MLSAQPNPAPGIYGARLAAAGWTGLWCVVLAGLGRAESGGPTATSSYRESILPLLEAHCFECHAEGAKKGGVEFDRFDSEAELLADADLWHRVLKNVRAGMMPPPDSDQPSREQRDQLQQWIKSDVFQLDAARPDPGRPVLRRLNRTEYRNTVRDLTGVDFRTEEEFPSDESGHGFDNLGEVLTVSPMLLEKYLDAARSIVAQAVPVKPPPATDPTVHGSEDDARSRDQPPNYRRWFPRDPPVDDAGRRTYARELLDAFASRAFRRPLTDDTADRLTAMAEAVWSQPGQSFEAGVARAMEAVLASPRFIFREEFTEPLESGKSHPLLDEFSLATRLSYFLWSTTPDEELLRLAAAGELRSQFDTQFQRLLASDRARAFFRNFVGQWLQARDIEGVPIDARFVLQRELKPDPEAEQARTRFLELRRKPEESLSAEEREEMERMRNTFRRSFGRFRDAEFRNDLRRDMRRETELYFEHVLRENRPLTELIDSDYTFLNERLANHYGVPGIQGNDLQKVVLPPDSPRGGILTHGTMLAVTSNPTRTSPVKRGLFILDNILGTPPPPAPPNVPALEDSNGRDRGPETTLRANLEKHRADPKCASCHNRMDPLGLAFENFNAMGQWREIDRGQPIDAAGQLVSGESFAGARELKKILVANHRDAFYRCFIEKLLMYSLGRGLDHRDETTIDSLLSVLHQTGGRPQALLQALVTSDAFQRRRSVNDRPREPKADH
jgi:mono/diheme cytochrome c family protein